ncbi:hypothetical protein GLYMA_05G200101v4 [Glycine max]|nr:hypothetical protein GLYMA_05G200101v4 [Glycine max]KAH1135380.1 hypothetical protein GYH30_013237 [Glycine max]
MKQLSDSKEPKLSLIFQKGFISLRNLVTSLIVHHCSTPRRRHSVINILKCLVALQLIMMPCLVYMGLTSCFFLLNKTFYRFPCSLLLLSLLGNQHVIWMAKTNYERGPSIHYSFTYKDFFIIYMLISFH